VCRVVTRDLMDALRDRQALDHAIESLERDLDRRCWSFSEAMTLMERLQRLRRLRSEIGFDEEQEEKRSPDR